MKAFKEIIAILIGSVLLFGGLGVMLSAEILNSIIIIGVLMMVGGIGFFVYIAKGILKEGK
ncbi:hypothetical protein ES695_20300 [Candidatus Atribacteria bacterium 1244-E10-H5-B2]|nr:MAG: hypothetical protein ES695_20300 [Candidatus Atribacteria bacterium 1244-E10-H5-B2]